MNVLVYAALCEKNWEMNLSDLGDYKRITTFYSDLSIAEYMEGLKGVKDTFNRVCKHWIGDYKYFTEFVMVLNHKGWAHRDNVDGSRIGMSKERATEFCKLYTELWGKADELFRNKYKDNDEALSYFYCVLD